MDDVPAGTERKRLCPPLPLRTQHEFDPNLPNAAGADPADNDILASYCDLFLPVKLAIHKSRHAGEDLAEARKRIAARFGLTIREYDSAATQVDGAIKSAVELRKTHAKDLRVSIAAIKKTIKNPKTKPKAKHQKKRRLAILEHRLSVAESKDLPSICFGTRKLFKAQHEIDPNDYAAHAEWRAEWQNARANQFLVVGDKNKIGGNLECRLTPTETGYIAHLRVERSHSRSRQHSRGCIWDLALLSQASEVSRVFVL